MERNNTIALEDLKLIHLNSAKVFSLVENLIPTTKAMTSSQIRGAAEKRICLMETYFHSPDYKRMSQNGYKFLAAVSEYTTKKRRLIMKVLKAILLCLELISCLKILLDGGKKVCL